MESTEEGVRSTVSGVGGGLRRAIADAPTAQSFVDVTAVPNLFLFDKTGKERRAKVVYGAPADFHEQIGKMLPDLMR